jgi:ABC-2 type transport system permease protein
LSRISPIKAIFLKDLVDLTRSRAVLFNLLAPIILSVIFAMVFGRHDMRPPILALSAAKDSGFGRFIRSARSFEIVECPDAASARTAVLTGRAPVAALVDEGGASPRMALLVDETYPTQVNFALVVLREMARSYASQDLPLQFTIEKVRELTGGPRLTMLPVWILFSLMGGLMIVTSSLVEEREKKTLAALLAAPVSIGEVVWGKVAVGSALTLSSVFLILLLNGAFSGNNGSLALLSCLGSLMFCLAGVVVGLSARSQTSAGALNSLLFMILFMPVVLADVSRMMAGVCRALPSFYLHEGIGRSMLAGFGAAALKGHFAVLSAAVVILFLASTYLIKRQEQ